MASSFDSCKDVICFNKLLDIIEDLSNALTILGSALISKFWFLTNSASLSSNASLTNSLNSSSFNVLPK